MNNFLYNTANFNVNTLNNEIQYYSQNMEKIREESTKYNSVFKLIDTQSTLFTLRNDIKDTEVQSFLLNIFETVLSDHKSEKKKKGPMDEIDRNNASAVENKKIKESEEGRGKCCIIF